ncbi:uncharacterized protein HNQ51_002986 [Inhella inkyongensis]|uniref:YecA family protein n=1 Tax=Inhella inkyongensis TaxID=392593 RepID=A0A840SBD1_9BURK|nr:UPF0149 family protein [Inhella inkyongensis]MBB5205659.1 uncharacterized protein [Inhella inkyongensis]
MAKDLTPQEFDELDTLLQNAPGELEAMDVAMLDGFLCGVLVQPDLLKTADWLAYVFDAEARELPADTDPAWLARTTELIERRHAALRKALAEDQWFDPIVLQLDGTEEPDPDPAFATLPDYSKPLVPFASGFVTALNTFPNGLLSMTDEAIELAMDRVARHLPCSDDDERAAMAELDAEHPLKTLDQAVEDMVLAVVEIDSLTESERYRVEPVRHETPKLGRNDPCHCGSGKKFKACHGAT